MLGGRLSIELEVELSKYLSLELVPVFVVIKSPPMLNYATYEKSSLHQESNGWGPLAGAALDRDHAPPAVAERADHAAAQCSARSGHYDFGFFHVQNTTPSENRTKKSKGYK